MSGPYDYWFEWSDNEFIWEISNRLFCSLIFEKIYWHRFNCLFFDPIFRPFFTLLLYLPFSQFKCMQMDLLSAKTHVFFFLKSIFLSLNKQHINSNSYAMLPIRGEEITNVGFSVDFENDLKISNSFANALFISSVLEIFCNSMKCTHEKHSHSHSRTHK